MTCLYLFDDQTHHSGRCYAAVRAGQFQLTDPVRFVPELKDLKVLDASGSSCLLAEDDNASASYAHHRHVVWLCGGH